MNKIHTSAVAAAAAHVSVGAHLEIRSATWKVQQIEEDSGHRVLHCVGKSGIVKGKRARFIDRFEPDLRVLDPVDIKLIPDNSPGFGQTKLFLEAAFRSSVPATEKPLTLGRAAIHDLAFQHDPVHRVLAQPRARLLISDDVGLGKTLEAGLIASELALRDRARRILVVSTRAMLGQFQKEFWTRFSIPLARLDSAAIKRMRDSIPAHYNVFDQFERVIVSIDTLKRDGAMRTALEDSRWDLVIIDEAHNAAERSQASGAKSLRAKLAKLLSRRADSLLLLTATPHDGSQASFASLIEMLDPTRVHNAEELRREDIEDLVVRRFRSSPDVQAALKEHVPQRVLRRRSFALNDLEDDAYRMVADLRLDLDETSGAPRPAHQLFRTTLAKALFSSPMACLETVENRLKRMSRGQAKGTEADRVALEKLGDQLSRIDASGFAKYQDLLCHLREIGWSGADPRDRLVIFSERIRTLEWLEEQLKTDLALEDAAIGRVDGGSLETDERTQKVLEDFGQRPAKIRILLASDMASEGLNLHFHCHRLIHFDLPWSLLRFQQRNGRIDRYGQDRPPEITYFVGESSHEKVRDMWVLEKLVEKDVAAQQGVGDPAVFLGAGDPQLEDEVTSVAIAAGIGAEAFERELDARANAASASRASDDLTALLFGEYSGIGTSTPEPEVLGHTHPPRLYESSFDYCAAMLRHLARSPETPLHSEPEVDDRGRLIRFKVPEDLKARDDFGYGRKNDVDDRYMPREAVGPGQTIELTDDMAAMSTAIDQAKGNERAWPTVQYLWDVHPILDWLNDQSEAFFGRLSAPICRIPGKLAPGEIAVIMHGAVTNRVGTPVVDCWGVVRVAPQDGLNWSIGPIEDAPSFLEGIGLMGNLPNTASADGSGLREALSRAIDRFQAHLVKEREARAVRLQQEQSERLEKLDMLRERFEKQLTLDFGDLNALTGTSQERRRRKRGNDRRLDVQEMFDDWTRWYRDTSDLVSDPNPYVDIKAVFQG